MQLTSFAVAVFSLSPCPMYSGSKYYVMYSPISRYNNSLFCKHAANFRYIEKFAPKGRPRVEKNLAFWYTASIRT